MNDLPAKAKRKRKLGVAPTKPQFAPGCTHFLPKCTQCKTKVLLQNDSRELYQFLGHFTWGYDGTGRHWGLKIPCFVRAGSNPAIPTSLLH